MSGFGLQLAEVADLVGDQARANILAMLMDGRALTALELAYAARVTPQTASSHLKKLTEGRLLAVEKQGRHRYYRLANPLVAKMLEAVMAVAAVGPPRYRPPSKLDDAMRRARTCYDHLAGRVGVALADSLVGRNLIVFDDDAGEVTPEGLAFFADLEIELSSPVRSRRVFCRPCLDWSERRPHLAGRVGAALADHCFDRGWLKRAPGSRAVHITDLGRDRFAHLFGIEPAALA